MVTARASLALVAATVTFALAAAGAGRAAAHPVGYDHEQIFIAHDPPPPPPTPPPPKKPHTPLGNELGFRMGVTVAGPASGFGFGLQGGLRFGASLHGIAEYEYLFLLRPDDGDPSGGDAMAPAGSPKPSAGRGHRGRVGLRVNLGDATLAHTIRFYADADATIGAAYIHGPAVGRDVVPEAALGLRLGYELMPRDESPTRTFDAHLLFRLVRTEHDTGMMFGVGMEWGKIPHKPE
ncbi:MAG TPA: hypothetical protein VHE35_32215 [Kofleriaceae bacterium]|nr:hypothetical protein [Kofleriaceae bacterium]